MESAFQDVFLRLNMIKIATISAVTPITPRPTPNPVPAFAPADRSFEDVRVAGETALDVRALVDDETELLVVNAEVGELADVAVAEVCCFTFHPTIAIAPAYGSYSMVAVAVVQSFVLIAVEAYVTTCPCDRSDAQLPLMPELSGVSFVREYSLRFRGQQEQDACPKLDVAYEGQHIARVLMPFDIDVATVDHPSGHVIGKRLTAV